MDGFEVRSRRCGTPAGRGAAAAGLAVLPLAQAAGGRGGAARWCGRRGCGRAGRGLASTAGHGGGRVDQQAVAVRPRRTATARRSAGRSRRWRSGAVTARPDAGAAVVGERAGRVAVAAGHGGGPLGRAARRWRAARPPDSWRGLAADAARPSTRRLVARVERLAAEVSVVRAGLVAAADAVGGVRAASPRRRTWPTGAGSRSRRTAPSPVRRSRRRPPCRPRWWTGSSRCCAPPRALDTDLAALLTAWRPAGARRDPSAAAVRSPPRSACSPRPTGRPRTTPAGGPRSPGRATAGRRRAPGVGRQPRRHPGRRPGRGEQGLLDGGLAGSTPTSVRCRPATTL
jgi:hypothetical protein